MRRMKRLFTAKTTKKEQRVDKNLWIFIKKQKKLKQKNKQTQQDQIVEDTE